MQGRAIDQSEQTTTTRRSRVMTQNPEMLQELARERLRPPERPAPRRDELPPSGSVLDTIVRRLRRLAGARPRRSIPQNAS